MWYQRHKGASQVSMVTSMLPQAENLPNIKKAIMSISCNLIARHNRYKQEGPCLHGVLERVEPKSNTFSVSDHHQVLRAALCCFKAPPCITSVNLHDDLAKWALFIILQTTKIKFREVNQLAPNTLHPLLTRLHLSPQGARKLGTQGQKGRDRKFLQ